MEGIHLADSVGVSVRTGTVPGTNHELAWATSERANGARESRTEAEGIKA